MGYIDCRSSKIATFYSKIYRRIDCKRKLNKKHQHHNNRHLGSTSYVTDADGNVAQHIEYIPYGEVFVEERNNSFSTNFLFNAKELDNETGLYYYGARYLDPTGAMWLSVDPLFEKYAGMSPYNYCAGNPVRFSDPLGMEVEDDVDDFINDDSHLLIGKFNHDCTDVEYRESCLSDDYSPIKDNPTTRDIVCGAIPVGDNYRNAIYGGCTAAACKSAWDFLGIDYPASVDSDRQDASLGVSIPMYWKDKNLEFARTNGKQMECNADHIYGNSSLVTDIKKMKNEGNVIVGTIGRPGGKGHTVVITGYHNSRRGRPMVDYWDNATGRYRSIVPSGFGNYTIFSRKDGKNPWMIVTVPYVIESKTLYLLER